ncbi:MAG: crossover junction endodeoxyribonuclease RuvC [Canibacter sp.]
MTTRVLGIDPGLTRCGIGVVRLGTGRNVEFEHVEVLLSPSKDELQDRIHQLGSSIKRLLDGPEPPTAIALERIFAQQNLPSVMGVAQISGVVLFLAAERGIPVTMYTPNEVKMQVTGYGAADKTQVTTMVTRLLGLKSPPKPADAADALALALTHAWYLSRTAGRPTGAKPNATGAETAAQRAWREAEQKAGRRRGVQRR